MWLTGNDLVAERDSTATKPYSQLALVFACVEELIQGISGLSPVLSTAAEEMVEGGPVYDVLFSNPNMSWDRFVADSIGHWALTRDVFWIFEFMGSVPMRVVNGTQMHAITSNGKADGDLIGWEFRGANGQRQMFGLREVHQWRNFNPYDRFHGIGPIQAVKLSVDYSYGAALFNQSALSNGAEPGIKLKTQGKLEPEEVSMLRSQFYGRHKGASKAKRTAVLTGGMDVATVAQTMVDMQMAEIAQMSDVRICSGFRVPPEVVGIITEAQYAQGPAQRDFVYNTLLPLAAVFGREVTTGILRRTGGDSARTVSARRDDKWSRMARKIAQKAQADLYLWFDPSTHPVVQQVERETAEKVFSFTSSGVPLNDLIRKHDLPYEEVAWGDDFWMSAGMVTARTLMELEMEPEPVLLEGEEEGEEEGEGAGETPATQGEGKAYKGGTPATQEEDKGGTPSLREKDERQRVRIWKRWVTSWVKLEREYQAAMRVLFVRQQKELAAKLKAAMEAEKAIKSPDQIVARVVFDLRKEGRRIRVVNRAFFEKGSRLGAAQAINELQGLTGEALVQAVGPIERRAEVRRAIEQSSERIVKGNGTTQHRVAAQLRTGLEKGEGLNDLTRRIQSVLGESRARAAMIARTQTAGAVSTGRQAAMRAAGVDRKGWLTARDNSVRPSHRKAEQDYGGGIPLDEPFVVGSSRLMYPGDPAGEAAEIVNCRCLQIAIAMAGKTMSLADYDGKAFLSSDEIERLFATKAADHG